MASTSELGNQSASGLAALPFEPAPAFRATSLQDDSEIADCGGKRIGILIVTYNAVGTLARVLKRITPNVWRNVEEVLVFDDASPDATYELAVGMKTLMDVPKLTVVKHPANLGYGGNQKAGYAYFIEGGFDIVVLLHGDGQYAPEILAHLYRPLVDGKADAVFGSRMMSDFGGPIKGGMPWYKFIGNRVLTIFENWSLGMNLTEFHSGYRAYNLHALREIQFSHMTGNFHFDTEIIIKLHHQNFKVVEIPIPTFYGAEVCYVNGLAYAHDVARAVWHYKQCVRSVARHPEFEEYFVQFPIKKLKNSSHSVIQALAGSGNSILQIGCGTGRFAADLTARKNQVAGIDVHPASEILSSVEHYVQADPEKGLPSSAELLAGAPYDRILLLDLVEHIRDSARLLSDCGPLLKPNGLIIVSVPNIANVTVRLRLLFGNFNYQERGILDKSHLRWFTRKSARKLLVDHGFEIVEEHLTNMPFELVIGFEPSNFLMRVMNRTLHLLTRIFPGLLGYEIVLVGRKLR